VPLNESSQDFLIHWAETSHDFLSHGIDVSLNSHCLSTRVAMIFLVWFCAYSHTHCIQEPGLRLIIIDQRMSTCLESLILTGLYMRKQPCRFHRVRPQISGWLWEFGADRVGGSGGEKPDLQSADTLSELHHRQRWSADVAWPGGYGADSVIQSKLLRWLMLTLWCLAQTVETEDARSQHWERAKPQRRGPVLQVALLQCFIGIAMYRSEGGQLHK